VTEHPVDQALPPTPYRSNGDPGREDTELSSARPPGAFDGPPPETFELARSWTIDSSRQLSALRSAISEAMTGGAAEDVPEPELDAVAENMVLIASELATNALKYGMPPTVVRLLRHDATFLLDVADHDPCTTPYVAGDRPAGDGGLGLHIAQRLAQDVGWYATDTAKHVWAMLPVPSDA
jgi:serine/threonine-protein kinase RsbW